MTETPQLLLAHHLKSLRLPTFLREYDKVAKQCAAEGIDYSRYLLRLAELELIDRERRMVERRIKAAHMHITLWMPRNRCNKTCVMQGRWCSLSKTKTPCQSLTRLLV
jgi:hypothetical protein